jgi:D-alanyl-D-alanine dipeptidase
MSSSDDAREILVATMLGAALTALAASWWLWSAR